jgi:uncharacterized protein (TIGR02391 family)
MNLQTRLDPRVWTAVQTSYEARTYKGAVLDSIHFLTQLIRDESGLDGDGVGLVGSAFGGQTPKLKVTRLQTESDWNVQRGVEALLRGLYQAIRNPRTHENYADTAEDADALLLLVNYLVKLIDQSRSPFEKEDFLKRIFDPLFVAKDPYAEALVGRIPTKHRLDIAVQVFRQKIPGKQEKLKSFFAAIIKALQSDELVQLYEIVSDELETVEDGTIIRIILATMPNDAWPHFSELARTRIENKLIESVRIGSYDRGNRKCLSGPLGTWVTGIHQHFTLKTELPAALLGKLRSEDEGEQDYGFEPAFPF